LTGGVADAVIVKNPCAKIGIAVLRARCVPHWESLKPLRILNRKAISRDEAEQFLCNRAKNRRSGFTGCLGVTDQSFAAFHKSLTQA